MHLGLKKEEETGLYELFRFAKTALKIQKKILIAWCESVALGLP